MQALLDYWYDNPPLRVLVKRFMAFMGYESPSEQVEEELDRSPFTLEELKRMAGEL